MAAVVEDTARGGAKRAKLDMGKEVEEEWGLPPHCGSVVKTVEMHAGGEPLRIFRLNDVDLGMWFGF